MSVLPDTPTLVAYLAACLVLFVTPGPDMSLTLARTIGSGRRAGIVTVLGTSLGTLIHTLAAVLGISALIAASATAFTVLKVVGALYLAWLAIDALRHGSALTVRAETVRGGLWRTFCLGLGVNLTNPKVVLFFLTFLPQFVRADSPNPTGQLAFLGLAFVGLALPLGILMVLGAARVTGALQARPRLMRGIDWLFAGLFGTFAARILLTVR
ncbi:MULTISPECIES: LysE family translocator [Methylobacterium]|jgi:threonine/homoserine/homoserine lactone efflux protein|uniref:Threonine transporter RhtB n=2 Tax=Methylobacterium TaxID=407 RepID=A0A0C6FVI3_9HYPH|nr:MULTISPECIES: LysE family translocator [Methylobacterium]MBK3397675.1 LysE family translocator [Methylobacterium ajmalii]MBK3411232.1 LysE family translocator [Methylobacterium ajmalii]MBK3426408.1 LysE family translocator [Methylobacterium ajmalii]MBZ6414621.1 LysE family translocator [Methylobacterium sp.]SEP39703.1 Threonine/homoserine/homoserine lactone efflux protein [Methylobacterium sp. ap11]